MVATSGLALFNPLCLFILFRESLEASIIVAVLTQYLYKTGRPELRFQVYWAVGLGVGASLVIGTAFIVLFYYAQSALFVDPAASIFTASIAVFACLMITALALMMLRTTDLRKKWVHKLGVGLAPKPAESAALLPDAPSSDEAASVASTSGSGSAAALGGKYAVFFLAFAAIVREGIESVLFLAGVAGNLSNPTALPIPGVIGIFLGILTGYFIFASGKAMSLRWFFVGSSALLLCISAGMAGRAASALQGIGAFGPWPADPTQRPWNNLAVWDWSACCNQQSSTNTPSFWNIFSAIFGYDSQPTVNELVAYFGYWVFVIPLAVRQSVETAANLRKWAADDAAAAALESESAALAESDARTDAAEGGVALTLGDLTLGGVDTVGGEKDVAGKLGEKDAARAAAGHEIDVELALIAARRAGGAGEGAGLGGEEAAASDVAPLA